MTMNEERELWAVELQEQRARFENWLLKNWRPGSSKIDLPVRIRESAIQELRNLQKWENGQDAHSEEFGG